MTLGRRILVMVALVGAGLFAYAAVLDLLQQHIEVRRRLFSVMDISTALLFFAAAAYLDRGARIVAKRVGRLVGRGVQVYGLLVGGTQVLLWISISQRFDHWWAAFFSIPVVFSAALAIAGVHGAFVQRQRELDDGPGDASLVGAPVGGSPAGEATAATDVDDTT